MIAGMSATQKQRRKVVVLLFLAFLHLGISAWSVTPGHLSVDEGTYHLMVRDRAAGHGFEIRNGYRDVPSPELIPATLVVHDGRLVAVPPELFTFLALPFYAALGYRGLFLLNALAFIATVALAARMAWRLTGDRDVGLDTALLLTAGTFLWEYSQAAWPHATATFLVLAAFAALVEAWTAEPGRRRLLWALGAGLAGGIALGVRVDSVLALPALVLPFLFLRPPAPAPALAAVAGMAPSLLALTWINRVKFGVARPLSYGLDKPAGELAEYLPVGLAAAVLLAVAWLASRKRTVEWLRHRGRRTAAVAAAGAALGAAAVLAMSPVLRGAAASAVSGLWQLVVDLRPRPLAWEPALMRTPQGGMVYIGALKKSLLQSLPWLPILVIPFAGLLLPGPGAARRTRSAVLLLSLVPAAYVGFYGALAWHGGLALNLRYFTPALPFLAALGGLAWRSLAGRGEIGATPPEAVPSRADEPPDESDGDPVAEGPPVGRLWLAAAALAAVGLHLGLRWLMPGLEEQQFVVLDLPLALAAALAVTALAWRLLAARRRPAAGWRRATGLLFVAGVAWAGAVALTYDYPHHRNHRAINLAMGSALRPAVPEDALLLVHSPDPYYALLEMPGLRLGSPPADDFADFRRVVDWHLDAGWPVVISWPPPVWRQLEARGLLRGYEMRPLIPGGLLIQIRRAADPAAPGDTAPRSEGPPPPR